MNQMIGWFESEYKILGWFDDNALDYSSPSSEHHTGSFSISIISEVTVTGKKLSLTAINTNVVSEVTVTGKKLSLTALNTNVISEVTVTGKKLSLTALNTNGISEVTVTGKKSSIKTTTMSILSSISTLGSKRIVCLISIDTELNCVISASKHSASFINITSLMQSLLVGAKCSKGTILSSGIIEIIMLGSKGLPPAILGNFDFNIESNVIVTGVKTIINQINPTSIVSINTEGFKTARFDISITCLFFVFVSNMFEGIELCKPYMFLDNLTPIYQYVYVIEKEEVVTEAFDSKEFYTLKNSINLRTSPLNKITQTNHPYNQSKEYVDSNRNYSFTKNLNNRYGYTYTLKESNITTINMAAYDILTILNSVNSHTSQGNSVYPKEE